jgi:hypothetical protein
VLIVLTAVAIMVESGFTPVALSLLADVAGAHKNNWGLPFLSSAMKLGWNTDLVPNGMVGWKDLFSEGLKGKIMLYNAYYQSLVAFAAAKADLDGKPGSARQMMESDLDGVLRFARDNAEWVKYFGDSDRAQRPATNWPDP